MILRPYQTQALDALRAQIAAGRRRVVLVAATGSGKTVMFSEMIRSATARGRRSVVIAHRKELIDQTVDKLARFGVAAGVIMGSDRRRDDFLPVQVCTIQTLAAWQRRGRPLPPADLVVADEAHHSTSASFRTVLGCWPDAVVIGATATPWRSDKIGLADIYEASVLAATPAELMDLGALVRYDAFAYDSPDLHKVRVVAGEFNAQDLDLACNTGVLVGSIVREYLDHGGGRRGVVFPVSVKHSQAVVGEFRSAGVAAEHLDCDTPKTTRESILAGLASGKVSVVSSVGVLTEGWDCPSAEVCMLARPTKSLSLFLQMIGRILRPSPGKLRALIHDHAGNLMRHGFPEDERDYSLTATPARVRELHTCPLCHAVFGALRDGRCPTCGEVIAPPAETQAAGGREEKQIIAGVRISREEIERIRAARGEAGIERELTDAQIAKVSAATREEKAAEFLRLRAVADAKGFKPIWASHRYRDAFGKFPSEERFTELEFESATPSHKPFLPLPPREKRASVPAPAATMDELEIVPGVDPFGGQG